MAKRGAIAIERWAKVGINRLRLTRAGLELLAAHGASVNDVFAPREATSLKDFQHTLWITIFGFSCRRSALRRMSSRRHGFFNASSAQVAG